MELAWEYSGGWSSVYLWLDDVDLGVDTGAATSTRRVEKVRLGAVEGVDSGTRGVLYLDSFVGRRTLSGVGTGHFLPGYAAMITAFVYDGDGQRVKGTVNGTLVYYLGDYFEYQPDGTNKIYRRYYASGGARVALRTVTVNGSGVEQSNVLNWLLGDHLGSQSLTLTAGGVITGEVRYRAWGEDRFTSGNTPTSLRYTGQRSEMGSLGLYFYGSRFYDPLLGRFNQADTIIPGIYNPLAFDRYSYCFNNPIIYLDLSGHGPMIHDSVGDSKLYLPPWDLDKDDERYLSGLQIHAKDDFLAGIEPPLRIVDPDYRGFGQSRGTNDDDNFGGKYAIRFHMAIDADRKKGHFVYPLGPGVVVAAGWSNDYGNYVLVEHDVYGVKFYSLYAHLGTEKNGGILCKPGDLVNPLMPIGTTGDTKGDSKGGLIHIDPHLHLEVRTTQNVNLPISSNQSSPNPFSNLPFWGYALSNWYLYFLDLGSVFGYDYTYRNMPYEMPKR